MKNVGVAEFLRIWDKICLMERMTDNGMCVALGITPVTVANWRKGTTNSVRLRVLHLIEQKFGYKIAVSQSGRLSLSASRRDRTTVPAGKTAPDQAPAHPATVNDLLFPYAQDLKLVGGQFEYVTTGMMSPFRQKELGSAVWIRMEDDSMEPVIHKHDLLLVSQDRQSTAPGIALAFKEGSPDGIVREIVWHKRISELVPKNSDKSRFKPEPIDIDHLAAAYPILCVVYSRSSSDFTPPSA